MKQGEKTGLFRDRRDKSRAPAGGPAPAAPKDSDKSALKSLMGLLARRPYSEKELEDRLLKKFPLEAAKQALAEAKACGWLQSGEELSRQFAASLHEKSKGWLYIKSRLRQRGLPCPPYDRGKELQKARAILSKKQIPLTGSLLEGQRQKAIRLLRNRGFEEEAIRALLSGFSDESG